MRVIAGEFRSRRLASVPGLETRPTPDRLRESLFNILAPRIPGAVFVDLYAGTGAVGIEALSRGASKALFVERGRTALQAIRENVRALGVADRAEIRPGRVTAMLDRVIDQTGAGIVFLDPPYDRETEYELVLEKLAENPPALVIAQHSARLVLKEAYGPLRRTRVVKQGDNALSVYER
ncbi:MAG TPA: 16S rRNA (guanine(966)-N(2))-methyltransferase RsmD [Bryobacteraceae bacterium]|nr:16S rRNA (guanine(966)-N(2))-methyltransferase RsmD [Bryobacteraceae bacterium]